MANVHTGADFFVEGYEEPACPVRVKYNIKEYAGNNHSVHSVPAAAQGNEPSHSVRTVWRETTPSPAAVEKRSFKEKVYSQLWKSRA